MPKAKHLIKEVEAAPDFPALEKDLLERWYKTGVVDKYLHKNDEAGKKFFFQDGPITANNPMGVHHAWGRTYKDLWQRYKAMRGFKQRFQNGFDCQGLWVEVEVEKELGFKTKKDIEKYGIAEFVEKCKERVYKFSTIQTDQSKRLGYFMDWDNSYFTMSEENNYMIWHFLKVCYDKGWIYKGHETVPWCPRCETAISQHEMLTEDYKELTHNSVFLKLPITTPGWENTFLLVWTTTPWTIPGNVAVGVNTKYTYGIQKDPNTGHKYILLVNGEEQRPTKREDQKSKAILSLEAWIMDGTGITLESPETLKGSELLGLQYTAPFDRLEKVQAARALNPALFHTVVDASNIVTDVEGTGLLHIAPGAGVEDFALSRELHLPLISLIADNADYLADLGQFSGQNAKKHPELIIDYLSSVGNEYLFKTLNYTHRYPACWRCKTELVWKVADEWYIAMDKVDPDDKKRRSLRQKMIDVAKSISWKPEFGLGRELDWLNNMHDWLISKKNRYWGLALPIWVCDQCGEFEVVGSKEELKQKAVSGFDAFEGHTPHKPFIDEVKIKHSCGGVMTRIGDVGNPWLDAGIVPFSTLVDPQTKKVSYTTDKKYFQEWFPADFITESFPGQFKNWFYSLIAMSAALEDTRPFETVLGFASVLAEDGRPMHKSWGNAIEFNEAADQIGVDVMRWTYARHNPERNLLFGFKTTSEVKRSFHMLLWNSYRFFANYAALEVWQPKIEFDQPPTKLDLWILNRLNQTSFEVEEALENYDAFTATQSIESFVSDLSLWYIRRSRDRVGPTANSETDKEVCYRTMRTIFDVLSRLLMPFTPFLADMIYTNVTGEETVHLSDWPDVNTPEVIDTNLIDQMREVRKICEFGHAARKEKLIAVKQPLARITVYGFSDKLAKEKEMIQLIKDELNVLEVIFADAKKAPSVELDLTISDELKEMGRVREILRSIQEARKTALCRLDERIDLVLPDWPENFTEEIKKKSLADSLAKGNEVKVIRK